MEHGLSPVCDSGRQTIGRFRDDRRPKTQWQDPGHYLSAKLNSWVYGLRAVPDILCVFVLRFFTTYSSSQPISLTAWRASWRAGAGIYYSILHEFIGEALSVLVMSMLMPSLFAAWLAPLLCSVVTSIPTVLLGLIVNKISDRAECL